MEKLTFAIDDISLNEWSDSQFAELVMHVCTPGDNAHHLPFDEDAMIRAMPSLVGKPILAKYSRMTKDATTHQDDQVPIGFIPHESDVTIEQKDGKPWIVARGKIWKIYARDMMEVLRRRKEANVSMEIAAEPERDENGRKFLKNFAFAGITVLGRNITPAIPGAKLKMLKFAEMEKALESEKFAHRYSVLDFEIPESIKDNVQRGMDLYSEHSVGGSAANLAMARYLLRESIIDFDHVRKIDSVSKRRFADVKNETQPSEQMISSLLWGGLEGRKWIGGIVAKMDELDNQEVALFAEVNDEADNKEIEVIPVVELDGFAEVLTTSQIDSILRSAVEALKFGDEDAEDEKHGSCSWVSDFNDQFAFVQHKGRVYRFTYVIEDLIGKIDFESKIEVIRGGYVEVGASIDEKKVAVDALISALGFSSDDYLDPIAKLAFLIKDAENFRKVVDAAKNAVSFMKDDLAGVNFAEPSEEDVEKLRMAFDGMQGFMQPMMDEVEDKEDDENEETYLFAALRKYAKVLFAHNAVEARKMSALAQFKAEAVEMSKFAKVEELLSSVSSDLLEEDVTEFRTFAKELPIDNFDAFANQVRAKAYERAKATNGKGTLKNKQTVHNFAVWQDDVHKEKTTGLWADIKNKSNKT